MTPHGAAAHTRTETSPVVLWVIGFFAFLNVYSMQSVLPMVMHDFQASPVQAGATVGATVLAIALVSPFMGMFSDAFGRKWIICASLFSLTPPTAAIALAHSLPLIVALRFIQGLAVPGVVVVLIAYIAEEFDPKRVARMTSIYVGGTVMGGFFGRFLTGHAGQLLGWRGAFLVLAALNFLGFLWVYKMLAPSRHFVAHADLRGALATLRRHLGNPRLLGVCAMGFCVLFSLVGAFTYVNLYLADPPFRLTSAGLANVFSVYLLGVVITPVAGRFIARYGFLRSVLSMLAVSACGLLLTLLPILAAVIGGLALCSSAIFICQTATISHIATSVKEGRSLATGIYYLSYYTGGAAGSAIAGLAFERSQWPGAVAAIISFQFLAALIAIFALADFKEQH